MSIFMHKYKITEVVEMRLYAHGENLARITVSPGDFPRKDMGMIARNPKDHQDQWYVARQYF